MQRSVAHFPLVPQCVVLGKSRSGQGSILFTFNPSTGKSVDKDFPLGVKLPYNVLQTLMLAHHGERLIIMMTICYVAVHAGADQGFAGPLAH